jgi:hypothetical protein
VLRGVRLQVWLEGIQVVEKGGRGKRKRRGLRQVSSLTSGHIPMLFKRLNVVSGERVKKASVGWKSG